MPSDTYAARPLQGLKSIEQHIREGINGLDDLKMALQTAVQLEFATIPPYLVALWSIKDDDGADPDNVAGIIEEIVIEEMFHFGAAGNILAAIGGMPVVATAAFLPEYPTHTLPGDIHQALEVGLKPLSRAQLAVFTQIEHPAFDPVGTRVAPATIGAFYAAIERALRERPPEIVEQPTFMTLDGWETIDTVDSAIRTIARIRAEGEGVEGVPEQPAPEDDFAHYYQFEEIRRGQRLEKVDGQWGYTGTAVTLPQVHDFAPGPIENSQAFIAALVAVMNQLQDCWRNGGEPSTSKMRALAREGRKLISRDGGGVTPEFRWPAA